MVDDGTTKNPHQRKRISDRESCINNVRIPNTSNHPRPLNNSTYTKQPRNKYQRGSLENVSTNPWGEVPSHSQSSLRRSRSLAITRDDIFSNNLDLIPPSKPRRSQLIPRAKLIDRGPPASRDPRYTIRGGSSVDNLHHHQERTIIKRKSSQPLQDYTQSVETCARDRTTYVATNHLVGPKFIIDGSIRDHNTENDSLNSNFYNKTSINPGYRVSYEDLTGLSLPNYYPDSKYDDTDNTDGLSLGDELSTESCDNTSKKYSSCDNISSGKWTVDEPESIPYDDNIVLTANRPLYDSIRENHYAKPRTIRGPTPFNRENQTYYQETKRSYSSASSEEKPVQESDQISLEYFETDTNFDEIKLKNENITKIPECSDNTNIEDAKEEEDEIIVEAAKINDDLIIPDQEYKTIVAVEAEAPIIIKEESEEEQNKHSHNYLREFLESQKGSKKPLQNFITKKLSNLSRKNSKETNLTDNRYYSLPDITVGKNLSKCEKIDRKLRKCEKAKSKKASSNESRFIVNIGKHFDISANNKIPVDFELKIAKVPKKNKKGHNHKSEEHFLDVVKHLKDTLNNDTLDENHNTISKPEIIALTKKTLEEQELSMNLSDEQNECTKEYQEKLGTMRSYWDKLLNSNTAKNEMKTDDRSCKIVDVQTKIEDVKKKLQEVNKEPETTKPSKVQIAKQLFEKKKQPEKRSSFIKDSCHYFEQPKDNPFESLNPNTVEIIDKEDIKPNTKKHKPLSKAKSVAYPEFDHVRYRVVKSDLFQKKIFANCEKESQFDGLMQYLQDYSFQELLRDNNIVIIEPIRTKIPHETSARSKTTKNITHLLHKNGKEEDCTDSNGLKRHFFYHPIRVNKEVNDDELPNPDTVKQVRQFFEGGLPRSKSSQEFQAPPSSQQTHQDPDKDHCSATDSTSNPSNISDFDGSQENLFDSLSEHCCEQQYVSEEILEKIRECGSTVTYYGGRVVKKLAQPSFTKLIMDEIKNNEKLLGDCNCPMNEDKSHDYQGVKFRLVKSNSCNSRLELVGTSDLTESKQKYLNNKQKRLKRVKEMDSENKYTIVDKNLINENIKKGLGENQPRIIGEEKKMTQWAESTKEKTFNGISYNEKPRSVTTFEYRNYEKSNQIDEMEFERYEVATN